MKVILLTISIFFIGLFPVWGQHSSQILTDPQLVGTWIYTINSSSGSGSSFIDKVTQVKWVLNADGTYESGASQSSQGNQKSEQWTDPQERGTWYNDNGKIYVTTRNGREIADSQQLYGTYYVDGNRMVFTGSDGKKAIWKKE